MFISFSISPNHQLGLPEILLALHAIGVEIAFCTGRSTEGALYALKCMPASLTFSLVTLNGVHVLGKGNVECLDRQLLHAHVSTPSLASRVFDVAMQQQLMVAQFLQRASNHFSSLVSSRKDSPSTGRVPPRVCLASHCLQLRRESRILPPARSRLVVPTTHGC